MLFCPPLPPFSPWYGVYFITFLFCTRKQTAIFIAHEHLNYMDVIRDKMYTYNSSMIILITKAMQLWDF